VNSFARVPLAALIVTCAGHSVAQSSYVDDTPAASTNWSTGTGATDKYGADYRFRPTAPVSDAAVWSINVPTAGSYDIFAWWPQGTNRSQTAGYHLPNGTVVTKNQQINGGSWQLLGTQSLAAGIRETKLSCWTTTGFVVMADAVRYYGPKGGTVPVGSRVVFTGDFNTGNFCQWSNIQKRGYNGSACSFAGDYGLSIRDGGSGHSTAARFEVRNGDIPPFGGGERSEVRAGSAADVYEGDERWYEFSTMFDPSFPNPTGGYFVIMQWHSASGSPPIAVEVNGQGGVEFRNGRNGKTTPIGPVRRGEWVNYVLHIKFSNNASVGYAEAWVNGVKSPSIHRDATMASSSNYLKMGIYRDSVETNTAILWHDGLRVTAP